VVVSLFVFDVSPTAGHALGSLPSLTSKEEF
jgi:hypothetical protein